MKRKVRFLVNTILFLCHPLSRGDSAIAQVPSLLQAASSVVLTSDNQEKFGQLYHLKGSVSIRYREMKLDADEMDYDAGAGIATAKGNVHFVRTGMNEEFWAAEGEYNLRTGAGSFSKVHGTIGAKIKATTTLLTTTNPFTIEAERMDRLESEAYKVYDAKITVCTLPDPTWNFLTSEAVIHPNENAYLYHSKLKVMNVPVFYFPVFYHSLKDNPRNSGFLTPTIGNNSRLGTFIGDSFFWAINRSADAEIGGQFLSARGWSQNATLRFRPSADGYLDLSYYGVVDKGYGPLKIDQGGRTATAAGAMPLPRGFRGVIDFHYLSSLTFRQAFTQTYNEAVFSENHSSGFATRNFDSFSLNGLVSSLQNFESGAATSAITIRQLPEFQFNSVERPILRDLPLLVSWQTSAGVVSREEPPPIAGAKIAKISNVYRMEFYPKVTLPMRLGAFHLTATAGYRARRYGERLEGGIAVGTPLFSGSHDVTVEMSFPSLMRTFSSLGPVHKARVKHIVEPKIAFNYVGGVRDFASAILFDERDLVSNTRNLEYSLANRFLVPGGEGAAARELLTWEVKQQYYLDPTFGNVIAPLQRNVLLPALEFSGNAFLYGARRFSPIVSNVRFHPLAHYGLELRQDYDTTLRRFSNAAFSGNVNYGNTFFSVGEFLVRTPEVLSPPSDQIHFTGGYGRQGRTGLNAAFTSAYDIRLGLVQYSAFQVSYNNNCCGVSFEYRRFSLGPVRVENQFRMAFTLANIGTFGNLKKQERLF